MKRTKEELKGRWRKWHSKEIHNMYVYSLSNIVGVIKSSKVLWAAQVACVGKFWSEEATWKT
jgi:hypothetical protein